MQQYHYLKMMSLVFILALPASVNAEPDAESAATLLQQAAREQMAGDYLAAQTTLQQAIAQADKEGNVIQRALTRSRLGDVLLATQQPETAHVYLDEGIKLARTANAPQLLAELLNHSANVYCVQRDYDQAIPSYIEAVTLTERDGDALLHLAIVLNLARAYTRQKNITSGLKYLEIALVKVRALPNNEVKGQQLLSLGELTLDIQEISPQSSLLFKAYDVFEEVRQLSENIQDIRLLTYAKGYLGQVYERQHRYSEALTLTNEAIFHAQQSQLDSATTMLVGTPDLSYQWEWQRGRLLRAQGRILEAITAFQKAVDYLQPIRGSLTLGQRNVQEIFNERIRPVYFGLADMLLQQAAIVAADKKPQLLYQARDVIEQLKAAELQDYFQDNCVSARITKLDHLDKHTAILYPIILPDRIELLLTLPDGILRQATVAVNADKLSQTASEFQKNLQIRTKWNFLDQSQQLYEWLIAPIRADLRAPINTLVIVPDGALRMIPMAALHNGQQFLIEEFALATTPGIYLTEPRPIPRQQISVLLQGLSKGVQNFSPLPNVPQEISNIKELFANNTVLLDQAFTLGNSSRNLQTTPFSIVHVASHGQFNRDPKKTFLLTYDDKLTMDRLENLLGFSQLRKEPVELLTLSACQTAVGDERAALGLAGVAIKAGARSALASLWFVNDEATAQLVTEFYTALQNPEFSRAQALQGAQKKLISQQTLRHPAYWSPFLLIGSWL